MSNEQYLKRVKPRINVRFPEVFDYRNAMGHGWTFYKCDGVLRRLDPDKTPRDDITMLRNVQDLELRGDDEIIVAFPKCGTHWLWEVITMIRSGGTEYSKQKKEVAMLGMPMYERAGELPSPRVLNSHLYFRHLPRTLVEKRIKTIHIMRNPKDVSVSYFHHFKGLKPPIGFEGSYSEYADLFLEGKVSCGSYFNYIKDWLQVEEDHPDLSLLSLYYENLKKNPETTIQTIAEFLGVPISTDLCEDIAVACSFTNLKVADVAVKERLAEGKQSPWRDDHVGMYRKGEIGDWKNWLTIAQNETFDDVIEREMEGTGINFIYE